MLKKLPIGKQSFESLIVDQCLYVDKTELIYKLTTTGSVYFLSRPRRFGKSLLISTLEQIFLGNRELFKDLWIYDQEFSWDTHPVIKISFSGAKYLNQDVLVEMINAQLETIAERYGISLNQEYNYCIRFAELIRKLSKINKVVVLVDEYDKPILDAIDNLELAQANRETLKAFYSVIKEADEYLKFVLLTGVSKFTKTGVFSGLNNLMDISMRRDYSMLCGYTQSELEKYFPEYIQELSLAAELTIEDAMAKIKHWYNGYRFSSLDLRVYNPFSTLLLFSHKEFKAHWFETGTPTFLLNLLKRDTISPQEIENRTCNEFAFSSYEIERLQVLPLLVQTGYLTIKEYIKEDDLYVLDYPNYEVRKAFEVWILDAYSYVNKEYIDSYLVQIIQAMQQNNLENLFDNLKIFFANIPYDIQIPQEKYYQSIFYLVFTLLGFRIEAEVRTEKGRIDAVAQTKADIYIFEFKLNGTAQEALDQIQAKNYVQKYQGSTKTIHLVGVEFNYTERNIGEWIEVLQS